jgi:hypothetical protein
METKSPLPTLNVVIAVCLTALISFTATAFAQSQPTAAPATSTAASSAKQAKQTAAVTLPGDKAQDPGAFVMNYLVAAGTLKSSATNKFLADGCRARHDLESCDLVPVSRGFRQTGWNFSAKDTTTKTETADSDTATVAARWVFHGGDTTWAKVWEFLLVRQNGTWKISEIK